ncbi:MAG: 50S ribosomal protein L11 methyltransferase [Holosporales bacterium]|jgi:ribosomal protein L11 methyltransferase|nr:50S ribosomal protein L11 methyltransferase [Holosporales bacterium]
MISCNFVAERSFEKAIDEFLQSIGITGFSCFENQALGCSEDVDEFGFPMVKFFNFEVFVDSSIEAENVHMSLVNQFKAAVSDFQVKEVREEDWSRLYLRELKPILCDRFLITSKHTPEVIHITLNSSLAFGSGHHQTTQGCLVNMLHLLDIGFSPQSVLDMGCGTGILGIGALKLWKNAKLLGIDIDKDAVKISEENYCANEINAKAVVADWLHESERYYDLILCNILKQPLIDMGESFYGSLNSHGYIIASGFIKQQAPEVIGCYESLGFAKVNEINMDEWISILFEKDDRRN